MTIDERFDRYDHVIIHCSATKRGMLIGAAQIDAWHRQRGWNGNGYHVVIKRNGVLQNHDKGDSCRPFDKQGAHVGDCGPGWNSRSLGVCLVGGLDEMERPEDNFTEDQMKALRSYLHLLGSYYENAGREAPTIMGHRDLIRITGAPAKSCPCFDVGNWLHSVGHSLDIIYDEDDGFTGSAILTPALWDVKKGDTLWRISSTTGVPISTMKKLNPFLNGKDIIHPGDEIVLR